MMLATGIGLVVTGALATIPVGVAIHEGRTVSTFGALWLAFAIEAMVVGLFVVGWARL